MEYKALYRKYRPALFSEVVGQESVVKTLINSIYENKVSHAYLFCGPRGTGKTTLAKLFAKAVNCLNPINGEPCNECEVCKKIKTNSTSDIIEIDAASNNGVDEIREIKSKVNYVSSDCKYKVYIIDEVHMLSISAFNALLKTLEEPPKHIIFILATTEPHKVPITVISRCQRFDLKKISLNIIKEKLINIASMENITIDDKAIEEIAKASDGGLRDSISLLDQVIAYKTNDIKANDVHFVRGTISIEEVFDFVSKLQKKNIEKILEYLNTFDDCGKDYFKLTEEIINFVKNAFISSYTKERFTQEEVEIYSKLMKQLSKDEILSMLDIFSKSLIDMKNTNDIKMMFEITVLKIINIDSKDETEEILNIKNDASQLQPISEIVETDKKEIVEKKLESKVEINEQFETQEKIMHVENNCNIDHIKDIRINNALANANKNILVKMKEEWNKIKDYSVNSKFSYVAGLLMDADIKVSSETNVILSYPYESMANNCNQNLFLIEELIELALTKKLKIIALSEREWLEVKKKYIQDLKNNIKYEIKEECNIVKEKIEVSEKNDKIEDVMDMFGQNIVEIN